MKAIFLHEPKTKKSLINSFKDFEAMTNRVAECDLLLRWGNISGTDAKARIVLNRKKPLKNSLDKEKTLEILKINKIRRPRFVLPKPDSAYPLVAKYFNPNTNLRKDKIVLNFSEAARSGADFFVEYINLIKKYHVYIFDLNVFLLNKKIPVKSSVSNAQTVWEYENVPDDLDQDSQKVCQLAQRAMYVLGLDFAMVRVGIDVRGRPVVIDINPTPPLNTLALKRFYNKVTEFLEVNQSLLSAPPYNAATLNNPQQLTLFENVSVSPDTSNVLIGSDPEFMLRDRTSGKLVYPSVYIDREGRLGYDERSEQRQGLLFPLAEIRPEPNYCPLLLVEDIRKILQQALQIFPANLEWLAGSLQFEQYQIGGHIHFSNIKLNCRLMRALDNYLGIPVLLMENPDTALKRRRQYGWIGSFRFKSHGGFEYRTPSSWLVSEEITTGCLCLAKIIASEYQRLTRDYFVDPEMQKAFYQAKKMYFYDIFNEIWEDITKTHLYHKYKDYLLPVKRIISSGAHWNEEADFKAAWGLASPTVT